MNQPSSCKFRLSVLSRIWCEMFTLNLLLISAVYMLLRREQKLFTKEWRASQLVTKYYHRNQVAILQIHFVHRCCTIFRHYRVCKMYNIISWGVDRQTCWVLYSNSMVLFKTYRCHFNSYISWARCVCVWYINRWQHFSCSVNRNNWKLFEQLHLPLTNVL